MRKFQLLATALALAMVGSGGAYAANTPASQLSAGKLSLPVSDQGDAVRYAQRDDDDRRDRRRGRGRGGDDGDRGNNQSGGDNNQDDDQSDRGNYRRGGDDNDRGRNYQRSRDTDRSDNDRRGRDRGQNYRRGDDDGRRDYDRRNYEQRGYDNRRDMRRGDWSRYHRNLRHDRRFNIGRYYGPSGYRYHRYRFGHRLPRIYFAPRFWLSEFWLYGLFPPPPGLIWVRYGPDALLIDRYTGEIIQVRYNVFY